MPKQAPKTEEFICDVCLKPVQIKDGIVQHRPMPHDYKVALSKWEQQEPAQGFRSLMDRPMRPNLWELGHLKCFADVYEDYWFHLDRCATPAAALRWTAHLGHKIWFDASDWARFIERHFLYKQRNNIDHSGAKPKQD
jgi:hypothetical protein